MHCPETAIGPCGSAAELVHTKVSILQFKAQSRDLSHCIWYVEGLVSSTNLQYFTIDFHKFLGIVLQSSDRCPDPKLVQGNDINRQHHMFVTIHWTLWEIAY